MLSQRQEELFQQLAEIDKTLDLTDDLNVYNAVEAFMIGVGGDAHGATFWLRDDFAHKPEHILARPERSEELRPELSTRA